MSDTTTTTVGDPKDVGALAAKLAEIYEAVQYVEKSGYNSHHKYKYAEEADIVEKIREELAARRVLLLPSTEHVDHTSGLTTASMMFTFFDGDTGAQITRKWSGTGWDKQDKGLYKAYTGANKYFLLKAFQIPTGDDPERVHEGRKKEAKERAEKKVTKHAEKWQKASSKFHAMVGDAVGDDGKGAVHDAVCALMGVDSFTDIDLEKLEGINAKISAKSGQARHAYLNGIVDKADNGKEAA